MIKKERKKKKRQIMQRRKLAKYFEATNNKFYWVAYKSLKVIGTASYSKQMCPTKRYRQGMVIPYPNRKKRIFSSSAYRIVPNYAKSFLNNFRMDIPEIVPTSAKDRALSDEEIKKLKKIRPKINFNHKDVIRKKKF